MIKRDCKMAEFLELVNKQMKKKYDIFVVIDGSEGVGKSRGLLLNMLEYWYKAILKQKEIPQWAINIDAKTWINNLDKAGEREMIGLDEAGDSMDSMQFATKFNRLLYQAYTIIREKLSFSIVVLPSFFDLAPRFRKRRVRFLVHAYRRMDNKCNNCGEAFVGKECPKCGSTHFNRGYVMYEVYDRVRINKILERNHYNHIKRVNCGIKPLFNGVLTEYEGGLKDYYSGLKKQKMVEVIEKLKDEMNPPDPESEKGKVVQKKCPHSDWRYVKSKNLWYCRNCGKVVHKNPYKGGEEDDYSA